MIIWHATCRSFEILRFVPSLRMTVSQSSDGGKKKAASPPSFPSLSLAENCHPEWEDFFKVRKV
jgi:hypothetical protein